MAPGESLPVGFARLLRARGLEVPTGATVTYARALAAVGLDDPDAVYWAGRATLLRRPEDVDVYDRCFAGYWGGGGPVAVATDRAELTVTLAMDDGADASEAGEPDAGEPDDSEAVLAVRWSAHEVLRHKDFAACTADELDEAHRLMADLRLTGALRRSRRMKPLPLPAAGSARRPSRARLDLRRTVRASLRAGGEPARLAHRAPGVRRRRIVLLLDISGSMAPYARALLRFAQASVAGGRQVEAFAMGTRLTRLTRELSSRDPDQALQRASSAVADWEGGTRLGAAFRAFNDAWGVRGMARGAVVVVLSDGWDRGEPAELGSEMARLRRVAHRIVWVNPLKATPGYEPLARGMAAALEHVDEFVPGHSLASLEALAGVLDQ